MYILGRSEMTLKHEGSTIKQLAIQGIYFQTMMDELLPQMVKRKRGKRKEVDFMPGLRVNFCETNVMSVCNASEKNIQKHCRFYGKSSYGEHCMFINYDQFCDNIEAQKNARNLEKNHR